MPGIIRKIDNLGRIVLPKDYRKTLHIKNEDELLIEIIGENISIKKITKLCSICRTNSDIINDIGVCKDCIGKIQKMKVL